MEVKKLSKCAEVIKDLKKEINRLSEERDNIETINKSHKDLNGSLRKELAEVKEDNKKLTKQLDDYRDNYIRIDGSK
nr:hypothetical protein [uncultured Mediterranean phage uvMED]